MLSERQSFSLQSVSHLCHYFGHFDAVRAWQAASKRSQIPVEGCNSTGKIKLLADTVIGVDFVGIVHSDTVVVQSAEYRIFCNAGFLAPTKIQVRSHTSKA